MKFGTLIPVLTSLVALSLSPQALAAQSAEAEVLAGKTDDMVGPINVPGTDLDSVLGMLEMWTGRSILRPQNLPALTLSLQLKHRVTKAEAIQAVETLLNLNGVAVTPMGDRFLKVTPLSAAKSEAPELIEGSTLLLPPSGRTASKLFQLSFLRVGEFMPQIAGLLNPAAGSPPVVFDKANAALITDSISNLQRIETLVNQLDRPVLGGLAPKFYTLTSAKASDVVNKMRAMLTGPLQTQLGTATSFNADDRTNQIVLIADPRQYGFFDELIARLDVRADPNTRNEVIYLKHAAAKDVASILSSLVDGQNNAAQSTGRRQSVVVQPATPTNQPNVAPPPSIASLAPQLDLDSANQFSAVLTILPEERSNSIVVSGTVDDLRLIQDLVAKIDVLLAQVRIEVVIAEVTLGDNATSGISELGLEISGDKLVGFSGTAAGISVPSATITPGVVGAGPYDLAATINLGTTPRKNNTNILSVPNIVTTHNKEGKIFVGEQRPVISSYLNDSTNTGTNIGTGYRSTVNSQKIGIELTVKPLIGPDGSVQLEIQQTVDDILGEVIIDGNPQPRIGSRETESFVSVRSGEIVVLGGLQRTSQSKSTSRLGPIPIIGDLLGRRTKENTRTDLVFFLRPTVLTNTPADNVPAMQQIEGFPKAQRGKLKSILEPAGSILDASGN
ncbi:MAG: type II secretory pathway, component PulD [Opitutaceae bacterium]|nr:type II secretory pathway, component PulD [Opitutaceae bacterium]